ncbi:hypothetical protein Tco_0627387 [Tanacetum coccineum]|uniref:Uncharacterized protein n=1 Tax=Tanacetum coccineum TaxID=301880 RepID=A0ABQ4WMB2_9ASTR
MIFGIEERRHGPSDAMHNPSQPLKITQFSSHSKTIFSLIDKMSPELEIVSGPKVVSAALNLLGWYRNTKEAKILKYQKESGEKHNLFENKTSVFQIKIDELEKYLAKQIKENSDLLIKIDNLENVFADEEKRATLGKLNAFDNENCDFESKVIHLKKINAQKSKDFDDVNLELSNRTAKF